MKFHTALLGASLFLGGQVSLAHPVSDSPLTERQSNIVVTSGATNGILPRYEIRQLQSTKPNQWILLLLAMQKWQQQSQSPPYTTSYFAIAKIHGVPFGNYNNVENCSQCNVGDVWGYCTHANVLFPAWHRAYLALFEQEFIKIAQSLVSTFPASRQADMQNAANKLRLPYYDWAAAPPNNGPVLPTMFTSPTISVDGPSGPQTINNPLYSIPINTPSDMYYGGFRNFKSTLRYPTSGYASATSQEQQAINAVSKNRGLRKSQVYQLLTGCKNYLSMSTSSGGGQGGCSNPLESIHDGFHNDVGGVNNGQNENFGGNMRNLPVAAFDPIFWFHHAMVDRLLAMWQTLNPSLWGAYQTIQPDTLGRTWTIPYNSVQGPDSPLTPFYRDNSGNFWTTNSVRDWSRTFQYTYPEYVNSDGSASSIMSYVNKLYSPSGSAPAGSSKRSLGSDLLSSLLPSSSTPSTTYWWTANIKSPHFALDGNYNLYTFLSQPQSEDPSSWLADPGYAGTASFLFTPRNPGMQVVRNSTALLTNAVPLNHALEPLVQAGKLASLNPEVISPFLAKNLVWRLQGPTGENVPAGEVRGLQVAVSSTVLKQSGNEGVMPEWSDLRVFPSITRDRAAGLKNLAAWGASTVGQVLGNATTVTEMLGGLGALVGDL